MFKLIFFTFFIFLSCLAKQENPGVKVTITERGLNFAVNTAISKLKKKLTHYKIPNIQSKSASLENIKIKKFVPPNAVLDTISSEGLNVVLKGGEIQVHGDWSAKLSFLKFSGSIEITSNKILLNQTISVSLFNNKPLLKAGSCLVDLGDFRIKVTGDASKLFTLILSLFKSKIQDGIEKKLCNELVKVINKNANEELKTLNLEAKINKKLKIDYTLVASPKFEESHLESSHRGRFVGDPQEDWKISSMVFKTSKMLSIGLADEVLNSLGRVVVKEKAFFYQVNITNEMVLEVFRSFMEVNAIFCEVTLSSPPVIKISSSGIQLDAEIETSVEDLSEKGRKNILKMKVNFETKVFAQVSDTKIYANISDFKTSVKSVNSEIPLVGSFIINFIIKSITPSVLPQVNQKLLEGFDLPKTKGVTFYNSSINYFSNYLVISTDVKEKEN